MMIFLSSVYAGTVGANNDGKLMNKAFLDIYLDQGQVQYQYAGYHGNGFELNSRTLNKAFDLYRQRNLDKAKIFISGRLALPKETKDNAVIVLKGVPDYINTHGSGNGFKELIYFYEQNVRGGRGYQLYLNGNLVSKNRLTLPVSRDAMGDPFIDLRIEIYAIYRNNPKSFLTYLDDVKKRVANLSFYVEFMAQAKRGKLAEIKQIPLKVYCLEE